MVVVGAPFVFAAIGLVLLYLPTARALLLFAGLAATALGLRALRRSPQAIGFVGDTSHPAFRGLSFSTGVLAMATAGSLIGLIVFDLDRWVPDGAGLGGIPVFLTSLWLVPLLFLAVGLGFILGLAGVPARPRQRVLLQGQAVVGLVFALTTFYFPPYRLLFLGVTGVSLAIAYLGAPLERPNGASGSMAHGAS